MKPRDIVDVVLVAALWGPSFLFMRVATPDFGAVPLAAVRVADAALLPLLAARSGLSGLRRYWRPVAWVGIPNSALPVPALSLVDLAGALNRSLRQWLAALALLCTGITYVPYLRLIPCTKPAPTIAVTFLVPAFAML